MSPVNDRVTVVSHPLIGRSLAVLRDHATACTSFRVHLRLVARLMTFRVTQDLAVNEVTVTTPLQDTQSHQLRRAVVLVPILRAGMGMADGLQDMIPDACVAHIGLARDEKTLQPQTYYQRFPKDLDQSDVLLIDPMLATGGSSIAAAQLLKQAGAKSIRFVNLVSCPEGLRAFHQTHPEISVYTAVIDAGLNDQAYIVPGLGDAGDRFYGTD